MAGLIARSNMTHSAWGSVTTHAFTLEEGSASLD